MLSFTTGFIGLDLAIWFVIILTGSYITLATTAILILLIEEICKTVSCKILSRFEDYE